MASTRRAKSSGSSSRSSSLGERRRRIEVGHDHRGRHDSPSAKLDPFDTVPSG